MRTTRRYRVAVLTRFQVPYLTFEAKLTQILFLEFKSTDGTVGGANERPNEPTVDDWFVLVNDNTADGADAWYDTLPAGKYELTIQRRLACCDGPMVESNKISFEVVQ